jgi:hypothetical protein
MGMRRRRGVYSGKEDEGYFSITMICRYGDLMEKEIWPYD